MQAGQGQVSGEYSRYLGWKSTVITLTALALALAMLLSLGLGSARVPVSDVFQSLLGLSSEQRVNAIVRGIRLPQALTAVVAGAGLSVAGVVMQAILCNPKV